jgi:hypothetical protein
MVKGKGGVKTYSLILEFTPEQMTMLLTEKGCSPEFHRIYIGIDALYTCKF